MAPKSSTVTQGRKAAAKLPLDPDPSLSTPTIKPIRSARAKFVGGLHPSL